MASLLFFQRNNTYCSDTIFAACQQQRHPVKNTDVCIPQCNIQQPSFRNQTVEMGIAQDLYMLPPAKAMFMLTAFAFSREDIPANSRTHILHRFCQNPRQLVFVKYMACLIDYQF